MSGVTGVVDLGVSNLGSVVNMLRKVGVQAQIIADPERLAEADRLILPGVGSYDAGMRSLRARGLEAPLTARLKAGTPILGICLGMQLLSEGSEEGSEPGLGWLPGRCRRFPAGEGRQRLRVPNMGWLEVERSGPATLFPNPALDARYYFVHSYYLECAAEGDVAAWATYGVRFTAGIQRGNLYGAQFHPEKSLRHGMAVLERFVTL